MEWLGEKDSSLIVFLHRRYIMTIVRLKKTPDGQSRYPFGQVAQLERGNERLDSISRDSSRLLETLECAEECCLQVIET
jgi:hypothetical protein